MIRKNIHTPFLNLERPRSQNEGAAFLIDPSCSLIFSPSSLKYFTSDILLKNMRVQGEMLGLK